VIDADGDWTYTVDNNAVQYLDEGETVTEIYTVSATDGTEHVVTITINGAEDPSEITVGEGDSDEGSVTEDVDVTLADTLVSEGSLTISDVDANDNPEFNPNGVFTPTGSTNAAALGSLVIDADGDWTYTVDNNAVQYLDEGESVTEIYTVSATDGTEHVVTITINGAEDPSEITVGEGDSDEGSVTEDVDVTLADTLVSEGSLTISDVDVNDNPEFNPNGVFTPTGSTNAAALGSLVIDADGDWTYTVDNNAVQYLDEGESVTEIYTVSATDGTEHVVTITINGAEDPSEITVGEGDSDEGSVTEDVGVTLAETLVSEGSLTITDVDANDNPEFNPNGVFTPTGSTNAAALGSLVIDADGDWTYTVDNNAVQYLDEGESVTEIYTVSATDGTEHVVTITI
ncbi:VCBS domain-containing protein, partial [Vibrio clamense]|uniref:VCBS domain-containing protein n=1 Tax=Vibrio clamense TaxID=2910254 RepID=UPI003D1C7BE8